VGKQKTYGRFLGTIFLEEVGAAHPVPGELVANVNPPKTVKNRKKSMFLAQPTLARTMQLDLGARASPPPPSASRRRHQAICIAEKKTVEQEPVGGTPTGGDRDGRAPQLHRHRLGHIRRTPHRIFLIPEVALMHEK
jgi:hypothetical protein